MQTLIVDAALIAQDETHWGPSEAEFMQTLNALRTPNLLAWLGSAQIQPSKALEAEDLNTPLEAGLGMALGTALDGSRMRQGLTGEAHTWARQHLPQEAMNHSPHEGWALITLCHWHANSGQVFMLDAPTLDESSTETLRVEFSDFFAPIGMTLYPYKPGAWLAKSELFHALPTTSLLRAMGQEVEPWLVGNTLNFPKNLLPQSHVLKRLQSEVQMLLYHHPVNQNRNPSLNSIWFSGTGTGTEQTQPIHWLADAFSQDSQAGRDSCKIWVSDHLRAPRRGGNWKDWAQELERLDAQLFGELNSRPIERLILCGTHSTKVWIAKHNDRLQSWLSKLSASIMSRPRLATVLHEN